MLGNVTSNFCLRKHVEKDKFIMRQLRYLICNFYSIFIFIHLNSFSFKFILLICNNFHINQYFPLPAKNNNFFSFFFSKKIERVQNLIFLTLKKLKYSHFFVLRFQGKLVWKWRMSSQTNLNLGFLIYLQIKDCNGQNVALKNGFW